MSDAEEQGVSLGGRGVTLKAQTFHGRPWYFVVFRYSHYHHPPVVVNDVTQMHPLRNMIERRRLSDEHDASVAEHLRYNEEAVLLFWAEIPADVAADWCEVFE